MHRPQDRRRSPDEVVLAAFERYLVGERGLAAGTIAGYVAHARRFLEGLAASGGLGGLTASEVTGVVCASRRPCR